MKYAKFALVGLMGLFAGCEEYYAKKDVEADGSTPYITISAPAHNSVFTKGENVRIESLLSDKDQVKQIEVKIVELNKNGQGNKPAISFKKFPKKNPFVLDTTFAAASLPVGEYLLTLNGIDGRTNVGTKEVKFSVK